jgi:hypothetical protein
MLKTAPTDKPVSTTKPVSSSTALTTVSTAPTPLGNAGTHSSLANVGVYEAMIKRRTSLLAKKYS